MTNTPSLSLVSSMEKCIGLRGLPDGSDVKVSASTFSIPGSGSSPGEGMTTHASILAWKIPWTEEPGRL